MKQKNVWIDEDDERSIALIRQRYGCESESQAVRLAIRIAARGKLQPIPSTAAPARAGIRKSRRPLYGLWRERSLAGLDLETIDASLAEVNAEWSLNAAALDTPKRRRKS
ncbi:MAG: hypothetical protein ABIQ99_07505 [Thermoflexales bacterium]